MLTTRESYKKCPPPIDKNIGNKFRSPIGYITITTITPDVWARRFFYD